MSQLASRVENDDKDTSNGGGGQRKIRGVRSMSPFIFSSENQQPPTFYDKKINTITEKADDKGHTLDVSTAASSRCNPASASGSAVILLHPSTCHAAVATITAVANNTEDENAPAATSSNQEHETKMSVRLQQLPHMIM